MARTTVIFEVTAGNSVPVEQASVTVEPVVRFGYGQGITVAAGVTYPVPADGRLSLGIEGGQLYRITVTARGEQDEAVYYVPESGTALEFRNLVQVTWEGNGSGVIVPEWAVEVTGAAASVQGFAAEAEADANRSELARQGAEQARAQVSGVVDDAAEAVRLSLEQEIGEAVAVSANAAALASTLNRKQPLTNMVEKVLAGGKCRILSTTTSIGSFDNSTPRLMVGQLQATYGDGGYYLQPLGVLGGSYENEPVPGARKQKYGGLQGTRLRLAPGVRVKVADYYTDEVTIGWSREFDSQPGTIWIDNVAQGQTGGPGAQSYRNLTKIALPLGNHTVELEGPSASAGGYAYFETSEPTITTQPGFEFFDASMGGMGIKHMAELWAAGNNQVPGIPIEGRNGLDYHFRRTDIDLFILEHITNDGPDFEKFREYVDYAVDQVRILGKPMLVITEPRQTPDAAWTQRYEYLLSLRKWGHVMVIDWHRAIYTTPATLMHSLYYTGTDTTHPDQRAYDVLNALVTSALNLPRFTSTSYNTTKARRMLGKFTPEPAGRVAAVDAPGVNPGGLALPAPSGLALIPRAQPFMDAHTTTTERYYRAPLRINRYRGQQKSIRTNPAGTDKFGPYIAGTAFYTDGPTTDLEVWVAVLKVAPATPGQNITIGLAGTAWQVTDLAGNPVAPQVQAPNRINQFIYTPPAGSVEPIVVCIPFRRLSTTSPSNGNLSVTGKVYDMTLTRSSVPVFDTNTTEQGMDYLYRALDAKPETAAIVTSGGPRLVRYQTEDFPAYEFRGLKTETDLFVYAGELVPGYRDARAVNLYPTLNAEIAASATSRTWGRYKSVGDRSLDFGTWGMAVGDVRRLTLRGSGGNLNVRVDGDARLSVNGKDALPDVGGTQYARMFTISAAGDAPAVLTVEILKRSNTGGSVSVSGDIYELAVTDSSVPILTDADGVL